MVEPASGGGDTSQSEVDPNGPFSLHRSATPMIAVAAEPVVVAAPVST
jgi:hypothetical protein